MDELEVLRTLRPDHRPLTADEHATVKEQLMSCIEESQPSVPAGPDTAVTTGQRPRRRAGRWIAMAGVAATIAVVAVVVGSTGHGPAPLQAAPSAARQLRSIAAEAAAVSPYPAAPFAVVSSTRLVTGPDGSPAATAESTTERTTWVTGDGTYVSRSEPCASDQLCWSPMDAAVPDAMVPAAGTAAEVRAGIERRVDAWMSVPSVVASRRWVTLTAIARSLTDPALSPAGRAELLRMVAENADLSSEPDVANDLGLVGTRFRAAAPGGLLELIIDPSDGYLLQTRSTNDRTATPARVVVQGHGATELPETAFAVSDMATAYRRPTLADPLPATVAELAAAVASHTDAIEAGLPNGGCAGPPADPADNRWGIAVPAGLTFVHCWLP